MDKCQAKQKSDQMQCDRCLLVWDINDPFPPTCICPPSDVVRFAPEGVPEILENALHTYKDRNKEYGSNWDRMGALLLALFPEGGIPPIRNEDDATRLNLLIDCAGKLQRYAHAFHKGGHRDSAHDLIIYAAKLEEQTK